MAKILVIDDDRDAADALGLLFETMGHDVKVGYAGDDALSMAEANVPHLIFLDLAMPHVDGFAAARWIRASAVAGHSLLVALTAMTDAGIDGATKAAGFDLYVTKPADFNVLIMIVDHLANRARGSAPKPSCA